MSAAGRAQTAAWAGLLDPAPAAPRREDAADEYTALVTGWWQGGYANIEK